MVLKGIWSKVHGIRFVFTLVTLVPKFRFTLIPKLRLGNLFYEAPASHNEPGSWSFQNTVPKPELGNEWSPELGNEGKRGYASFSPNSLQPNSLQPITARVIRSPSFPPVVGAADPIHELFDGLEVVHAAHCNQGVMVGTRYYLQLF